MVYKLRFFFDPGSRTCLWADGEEARQKFGYPVLLDELPISEDLKQSLDRLISRYDTSLDWNNPPDVRWTVQESRDFLAATQLTLGLLRSELPASQYLVLDETGA